MAFARRLNVGAFCGNNRTWAPQSSRLPLSPAVYPLACPLAPRPSRLRVQLICPEDNPACNSRSEWRRSRDADVFRARGFSDVRFLCNNKNTINNNRSINQSINLYLNQTKAHTHTHAQNTTTIYSERNKKETVQIFHQ